LKEPKGLSRERLISGMWTEGLRTFFLLSTGSDGGDSEAAKRKRFPCSFSSECSMSLYSFLSLPAALVV
jgi:hypothetical protein